MIKLMPPADARLATAAALKAFTVASIEYHEAAYALAALESDPTRIGPAIFQSRWAAESYYRSALDMTHEESVDYVAEALIAGRCTIDSDPKTVGTWDKDHRWKEHFYSAKILELRPRVEELQRAKNAAEAAYEDARALEVFINRLDVGERSDKSVATLAELKEALNADCYPSWKNPPHEGPGYCVVVSSFGRPRPMSRPGTAIPTGEQLEALCKFPGNTRINTYRYKGAEFRVAVLRQFDSRNMHYVLDGDTATRVASVTAALREIKKTIKCQK